MAKKRGSLQNYLKKKLPANPGSPEQKMRIIARAEERVSGGAAAGATFLRCHYLSNPLETEKEENSLTSSR